MFNDSKRDQTSLLAPLEKRALIWLAHRLPAWVSSDQLTLVGFVAMFLAGLSYWAAHWNPRALLLVNLWLVINWFGDSLDGTVARVRGKLRPDTGSTWTTSRTPSERSFCSAGSDFQAYISRPVAMGLLIVYFLLSIEVYLATYAVGTFHLSHFKFSPTELRLLLIVGNTTALFQPRVIGDRYLLFDVGGTIGIVGMGLMTAVAAIRHSWALYQQERV